jgi:membrane-bound metal-dependent hydrolase YbcI (DUF457 family)
MNYKGHMIGALLFLIASLMMLAAAGYYIKPLFIMQAIFFVILGALFPDIDTKSKGQKLFYAVLFIVVIGLLVYKRYYAGLALALLGFCPLFVNHRALFHTFWFSGVVVIVLVLGCHFYCPAYTNAGIRNGLFFLVGVLSHLILDFGPRKFLTK